MQHDLKCVHTSWPSLSNAVSPCVILRWHYICFVHLQCHPPKWPCSPLCQEHTYNNLIYTQWEYRQERHQEHTLLGWHHQLLSCTRRIYSTRCHWSDLEQVKMITVSAITALNACNIIYIYKGSYRAEKYIIALDIV